MVRMCYYSWSVIYLRQSSHSLKILKMMNRKKVMFDFVKGKPIESTDCEEDMSEPQSPRRERSQSSMPYEEILRRELLKSPVTR